jgi:hypothetical protein
MAKKYIVDLNLIRVITTAIALLKQVSIRHEPKPFANILLMASEGYPDDAIASSLRVNVSTVERKE